MSFLLFFRASLYEIRDIKLIDYFEKFFWGYSMNRIILSSLVLLFTYSSFAKDSEIKITWGGYVDSQFAYDLNKPASGDRAFFTQPAAHNEFNLNLGHLDVNLASEKIRGRFALQAGTSVQVNYAGEPQTGSLGGPDLAQHIQEARLGYKLSDKTWIDAGVFFAHVGAESWISQNNLTLTRSFVAEYSPYYLSGVKLTHMMNDNLTLQLLVTNGWQNIAENNTDKNIGTGIEYAMDRIVLAYNTLIGREISSDLNGNPRDAEFRHFHNFIVKNKDAKIFEWILQVDTGFQTKPGESDFSQWFGASLMGRYQIAENKKIALRLEHFQDKDQIVFITNQPDGFNAIGGSIGFDQTLESGIAHNLQWRTELRYIVADADVFPKNNSELSKTNLTATTSLSFSF